jgi:DNA polymerase-1
MPEFKSKLLLFDGHALLYRAYHALPGLTNSQGFPTGAIFGFFSMFLKALEDVKPTHVCVTFDVKGPTFRDKLVGDYKAHRKPTPDDLNLQLPKVKEILEAMSVPVYEKSGFEADDLLGIISRKSGKEVYNIIATGDMDLLQLINSNTVVYRFKKGFTDIIVYDVEQMMKEYGLTPDQWVDLKSLKGDASDNIPGVAGIGEKTALELIKKFKTLDGVYKEARKKNPDMKPAVAAKLLAGEHYAYLSHKLALIDPTNKYDEFDLGKTMLADYDQQRTIELFTELSIKSLIPKLPKLSTVATKKLVASQKRDFTVVDTKEKLEELVKLLKKQSGFAIDTQTTKDLPLNAQLVGMSFAVREGQSYYVPTFQHTELGALEALKAVLEDRTIDKYGHNLKADFLVLKKYGINLAPLAFDTQIAAYLANPGLRSYELSSLGVSEFNLMKQELDGFANKDKSEIPFDELELAHAANYACEDVDVTFRLRGKLENELKEKKLWNLFTEIEMPLVQVLAYMEEWGVKLDVEWLRKLSGDAEKQIATLEKQIYKMAGIEFNISSPKQLGEVLFEKLKIQSPDMRNKRGKSGALSTAAAVLERLREQHPIIDLIFDYRELTKLKSTYLDALPELVSKIDKRVHTTYTQTIAATGRLSSSDPNLQNIPIRTALGREVRKGFIAETGFKLVSIDYSQIELRIAASLSSDPEMTQIFKSGKDFHTATAARIFNVMESQVNADQRRDAKTINFSVLYGVSAFGLSSRSAMGHAEASDFIKRYYQVFAGLKKYIDKQIGEVHKKEYTVNLLGRIRYYPEINSPNFAIRGAAERQAINAPIQSLQADFIKIAMNKIKATIVNEDCRMLLQVHDELVFEIKEDKLKYYIPQIKEIMESVYKLKVPIIADAKVGDNWNEMQKFR